MCGAQVPWQQRGRAGRAGEGEQPGLWCHGSIPSASQAGGHTAFPAVGNVLGMFIFVSSFLFQSHSVLHFLKCSEPRPPCTEGQLSVPSRISLSPLFAASSPPCPPPWAGRAGLSCPQIFPTAISRLEGQAQALATSHLLGELS